ncbi:hypothetical protein CMU38_11010 [Elizabethkingia anophelis]|nr:hypothetical protein [Elizabethkingia anophelis]
MKYKIAYVDESAQWIQTFYQTFKYDFDIVKILVDKDCSIELVLKTLFESELDAIVTDFLLEEEGDVSFNGNKIVEGVRNFKPHFPIVMLTAHEPQAISHMDDVHIIYGKNILDGESEEELELFKTKIKTNIGNYYSKISETHNRIENLVKKRNKEDLTIEEEEDLSKLFILLDELEPESKGLPSNLVQKESVTKLNDFVTQARNILEELKKMNNR